MDVHYKPDPWQEMKEGIDQLTKEALRELTKVNDLLEEIESKIHSLDSDRSINFQHSSQQKKINQLLDAYTTLGNYCTQAGRVVSRHIDEPFYKDMDKFAGKMRDLSIRNYSTKNRIGSTSTTTMPNAHGYGMAQTITTKKDKITVDDIFKDSVAFDKVLRAQYKEIKQENPDAKLDYAEYRKLVPSMRGFEYKTREDEQKKLEMWRDLVIGAGLIILTIACPPAGLTAAALYGGLQLKSAYDGKDWGTGRKLSDAERAENGIFGALDAIPVLGTAVKGFKGLDSALSLAKLSKMQEAGKVFNPNTGKNVVQSLHNSKNIMLDRMKLGSLKVEKYGNDKMYQLGGKLAKSIDNMTAKTKSFEINEHGVITAKQGGTDFHSWVNKHHTESSKIIDDKIKSVEGSLAKGTVKGSTGVSEVKTFVDKGKQFTNGRKNRLKPDIRYKTGEYDYFYETDNLGRIEKFETDKLQLTEREKRLSHSKNTPGKVKGQDHAGHLAGDRFGGSPKIDNLVSQLSDVNLKKYKKVEDKWAAALKETPPKKVTVKVDIIYSGNDVRPDKFIVNYTIDGKPGSAKFKNL
ncbi:DNA/RNA non-specific endonuclease [Bacillus sp. S14(2024)]|uniref:DNA/RNA non-specific endonuclease n=1 Tax=Bacillus sp. S14(2024) TaxID=3162884 RepID=UPI003D246C0D